MTPSGQHFQKPSISFEIDHKVCTSLSSFYLLEFVLADSLLVCSASVMGTALKFSKCVCYTPKSLFTHSCPACIHKWFPGLQSLTCTSPFQSELHSYFYAKCGLSTFCVHPFSALFPCGVCYGLVCFLIKGILTS